MCQDGHTGRALVRNLHGFLPAHVTCRSLDAAESHASRLLCPTTSDDHR